MSTPTSPLPLLNALAVDRTQARKALVFGVQVEILLGATDTGGTHSLYLVTPAPGTGAPPHVHHRDDETFFILEGEVEVLLGETWTPARPGATVYLPRGVPHAFRNATQEPAVFLAVATPGGHDEFFLEADRLARAGELNPESAVELCGRFGMELLPLPG